MSGKRHLAINVLEAAQDRISQVFDDFERIYLSFSGGKDSTVMLHLVMQEAIRRNRKIGILFIDLEAQYAATIEHVTACFDLYAPHVIPYWVCLPLSLRNAVSMYEPRWICWDKAQQNLWVRSLPPAVMSDPDYFPFFRHGMEFEEFINRFSLFFGEEHLTACFVGIRADESLNRYRAICGRKSRYNNWHWTTYKSHAVYNVYPIYDWGTEDIWTYHARTGLPYNRVYDLMHQAGLSVHQMRICQPYGDDQKKGLWLYHTLEPETWGKVVARVNGANSGSIYAHQSGNMLGNIKITKPEGYTWQSFARLLLESLPPNSKEHYENKVAVFLHWYELRGYPQGIPDEADLKDEASKKVPSWRRVCKALLKNDYWCKSLSFSQTKSDAYERYMKTMKNRRERWIA